MSKKFRIISAIVSVLMLFQCLGIITFAKAAQDTAVPTLYDVTSSKAYAVSEITSKREENVKHFRMSDGSFAAMSYSVPVHYDNGAGWQDIDNTLASSTDEGANVYNNVSNGIDFKFAKSQTVTI